MEQEAAGVAAQGLGGSAGAAAAGHAVVHHLQGAGGRLPDGKWTGKIRTSLGLPHQMCGSKWCPAPLCGDPTLGDADRPLPYPGVFSCVSVCVMSELSLYCGVWL